MPFPFSFWKSSAAAFNPATLALSGWWRVYSASPEVAVASAGSSGSNGNLTEATNPPGTTTLNSLNVADYDGTNDKLANANNIDTFVTAGAYSFAVLANMDTAGASAVGAAYGEPCMVGDATNGFLSLSFSTRGWTLSMFNGAAFKEVNVACATGAWHLVQAWYDGTNMKISLDDGSAASTASANFFGAATVLRTGINFDGTKFIDGKAADIMAAAVDLGATARTNIKSYVNSRYALSL